jgi:hypothetical protein
MGNATRGAMLVLAALASTLSSASSASVEPLTRPQRLHFAAVRGATIGPIENALHPDRGYGSAACARALAEARRMGATWVSLTPFARVWDLKPTGLSLSFEWEFDRSRRAVLRTIEQAHAEGLRVLIVPHLWVESGDWRALIDPATDAGWQRWADAYEAFLRNWAAVAEDGGADMLAVGVELRSWVTTTRAASFVDIIRRTRQVYSGPLTYAANWDDVEQTVILGELDAIGINAFYPLAEREGAALPELARGATAIAERVRRLAADWGKPVIFTEFGYTTRTDPAVKPWLWPEQLGRVTVDQLAQADAYRALLGAMMDEPAFAGFFVWRLYADPEDTSQEAEWGFSPRGKLAELVLRDAYNAHFAADGVRKNSASTVPRAERVGVY